MAFDDSISFCGLDATVRMEDSSEKYTMNNRKHDIPFEKIYPLDIQFYTGKPCPLSIEKMKALVKERILVLKEVHLVMKKLEHTTLRDKRKNLTSKLGIMRLHRYARFINSKGHRTLSTQEIEDRIADHASFVALQLSVAADDEARALHQRIEEELFNLRVYALDNQGIRELLEYQKIEYEKINNSERIKLKQELSELLDNSDNYDTTEFFKIPILKLLGFLTLHEVHLKNGVAFLPLEKMPAVLRVHYHNHLGDETDAVNIDNLQKACKIVDGHTKFNEFFEYCSKEFEIMHQKILKESNISIAMIDMLAKNAFPPCMRIIHESLRKNHHLKHGSRLQYTLFLKGIGLKVQDTLALFQKEFIKTVTLERFQREYTYYIYHAYGMKGRRYDTPPKDCSLIIDSTTSFGDCNGCVFAHAGVTDIEDLSRNMTQWNISSEYTEEMIEYTKSGNCGNACATYFQALNKHSLNGPVTHPNKFFYESRRLSSLPKGCISDESDESDNDNNENDIQVNVDDHQSISINSSHHSYIELVQLLIDWETKMMSKNLKAGSIIKLNL